MELSEMKRVLIIGAGTMGHQIGFVCAMHGYTVVIYDISTENLAKGMERIQRLGEWFQKTGRLDAAGLQAALARITTTTDPVQAACDVDLISESIVEDPTIKAKVFAQFNALCPERTIFTTNTSTLVPSMFAEATGRPARLAALHFHDVRTSNVVDIMPHPGTDPAVIALIQAFARSIGQIAILLKKEHHGYVFNTMLSSLFSSALNLASREVTSVEEIDRAWMGVMHMPIGPFGIMDQIGLTTVWHIVQYWAKETGDLQLQMNADFLKAYIDQGHLGIKTRQGFYTYPNPAYARPGFLAAEPPQA